MNLKELKESDRIIFETISGSIAYGTNVETSDIDVRGFFMLPNEDYLSLIDPLQQIGDEKHDTTYYSLKRGFELLQKANPNMIELLWMPKDCVKIMTPQMEQIIENRDLFISKECFHTHSGYAFAQLKKCRGQNKKVHNPMPEERPKKEDFCFLLGYNSDGFMGTPEEDQFPCRPRLLKDVGIDLSQYHASSLEHSHNIFRIYNYGKEGKGVFRGNDMLVCESIPKEDEFTRFEGLLIYNKDEFEKSLKEHRSYWDWKKNRNDARWIDQEKGKLPYDQKNMMHCMRLLMSGENILKEGFPLVRFEGEQQKFLMSIRNGERDYDDLMNEVEKRMANLEELYRSSIIPHSVNVKKINRLYMDITGI